MSIPSPLTIPLTSSHHQKPFKLLELPPELLSALESETPPTLTITTSASTGNAILTFGSKQYHMRQKNTSNPIMVLRASTTSAPAQPGDAGSLALTSIATVEDTIELILEEGKEAPLKVNKWHEKFAKSRMGGKG